MCLSELTLEDNIKLQTTSLLCAPGDGGTTSTYLKGQITSLYLVNILLTVIKHFQLQKWEEKQKGNMIEELYKPKLSAGRKLFL